MKVSAYAIRILKNGKSTILRFPPPYILNWSILTKNNIHETLIKISLLLFASNSIDLFLNNCMTIIKEAIIKRNKNPYP